MGSSEPDSVAVNRELWTRSNAEYTDRQALGKWMQDEIDWGTWGIPESRVGALPDLAGMDVVELGCGTAYVSAWLAKRGARPIGVDPTPTQLETARRCMAETGIEFRLVEAPAESVPLPDASADLVISEYGASIYDEIGRMDWRHDSGGIEFHPPPGELIRLLRANGFAIEALIELRAPEGATQHEYYDHVTVEWARRWPDEEIWKARKAG
jgi:SAM-dependent methyltransferase